GGRGAVVRTAPEDAGGASMRCSWGTVPGGAGCGAGGAFGGYRVRCALPGGSGFEIGKVPLMSERAHLLAEALKDRLDVAFPVRGAAFGVGFPFAGKEPDEPYVVENYVGDEHEEAMTKELAKELVAGRIFGACDWLPRSVSALGMVERLCKGKLKHRPVWDYSLPSFVGVFDWIDLQKDDFTSVKDAFALLRPGMYMVKVDLEEAYRRKVESLLGLLAFCAQVVWGLSLYMRQGFALVAATSGRSRVAVSTGVMQDLKFSPVLFAEMDEEFGPFTLDACVASWRANVFCMRSWSAEDDARKQRFDGLNAWANLPFSVMYEISLNFLKCKRKQQMGTGGCFLVPVWEGDEAYELVSGMREVFCPVEGRGKRGALVPMSHAVLVAGLKKLAEQRRSSLEEHHWRSSQYSTEIIRCNNNVACQPSQENLQKLAQGQFEQDLQCADGYTGPICGAPAVSATERLGCSDTQAWEARRFAAPALC
ncbi:hypothetical protein CYMTET_33270, partial [Cymbomonas tetramitiformis]